MAQHTVGMAAIGAALKGINFDGASNGSPYADLTEEEKREMFEQSYRERLDVVMEGLRAVRGGQLDGETYDREVRKHIFVLNALLPTRGAAPVTEEISDRLLTTIFLACAILDWLQAHGCLLVGQSFKAGDQHMLLTEYVPHYQSVIDAVNRVYCNVAEVVARRQAAAARAHAARGIPTEVPVKIDEVQVQAEVSARKSRLAKVRDVLERFRVAHRQDWKHRCDTAKRTLSPMVEQVLDNEIRDFVDSNLPTLEDEMKKEGVRRMLEATIQTKWPDCSLHLFGSSANGLGFMSADMDLVLEIDLPSPMPPRPQPRSVNGEDGGLAAEDGAAGLEAGGGDRAHDTAKEGEGSRTSARQKAEATMVLALQELFGQPEHRHHFSKIETIPTARVPIVKIHHVASGIECDICINNTLALHNTRLLKTYSMVDKRLVYVALALKYWAKMRGIGDPANCTLSSYALVNMLIHYLQQTKPPVLCNLQSPALCKEYRFNNGPGVAFCDNVVMARMSLRQGNDKSVAALLHGCMVYYAFDFDIRGKVVAISSEKPALDKRDYRASTMSRKWRIAIQDPFEEPHDLGSVIYDPAGQMLIVDEFDRAQQLMHFGMFKERLCERRPDIKAIPKTCQGCGAADHIYRDCALSLAPTCANCGSYGHQMKNCPENVICNRCGENGHRARDCNLPRRGVRTCHSCGEPGHISRNCPKNTLQGGMRRSHDQQHTDINRVNGMAGGSVLSSMLSSAGRTASRPLYQPFLHSSTERSMGANLPAHTMPDRQRDDHWWTPESPPTTGYIGMANSDADIYGRRMGGVGTPNRKPMSSSYTGQMGAAPARPAGNHRAHTREHFF